MGCVCACNGANHADGVAHWGSRTAVRIARFALQLRDGFASFAGRSDCSVGAGAGICVHGFVDRWQLRPVLEYSADQIYRPHDSSRPAWRALRRCRRHDGLSGCEALRTGYALAARDIDCLHGGGAGDGPLEERATYRWASIATARQFGSRHPAGIGFGDFQLCRL